jgi:hypothetical protein
MDRPINSSAKNHTADVESGQTRIVARNASDDFSQSFLDSRTQWRKSASQSRHQFIIFTLKVGNEILVWFTPDKACGETPRRCRALVNSPLLLSGVATLHCFHMLESSGISVVL